MSEQVKRFPSGYWEDWEHLVIYLKEVMEENHGLIPAGGWDHPYKHRIKYAINKYHGGINAVRKKLGIDRLKYCATCDKVLPFEDFRVRSKNGDGQKPEYYRDSICKKCNYKRVSSYRETDKGQAANLVRMVRYRAKRDKLPFNLTTKWVLKRLNEIGWRCELTGIEFNRTATNFFESYTSLSCDQIRPGDGYITDNVQFVIAWANRAKGVLSQSQFIELCKAVAENSNND